jgi:hypothetical protein
MSLERFTPGRCLAFAKVSQWRPLLQCYGFSLWPLLHHVWHPWQYFSSVASLEIFFQCDIPGDALFSVWTAITLESLFMMQLWTPMARNLWSPKSKVSYSAILYVHLSVSLVNCSLTAYLSLIPDGEIRIVEALALAFPQAPSHYTNQGDLGARPSMKVLGSVQSIMKSAST